MEISQTPLCLIPHATYSGTRCYVVPRLQSKGEWSAHLSASALKAAMRPQTKVNGKSTNNENPQMVFEKSDIGTSLLRIPMM
mmetsp:Transcript_35458/g.68891  ORF Transcript_35458/g.68891 Transcript_35458/m.68891 type:complete len:82 (+) Transcript_35458:216-461(+)